MANLNLLCCVLFFTIESHVIVLISSEVHLKNVCIFNFALNPRISKKYI